MENYLEEGVTAVAQFEKRIHNAFDKLLQNIAILLERMLVRLKAFRRSVRHCLRRLARAFSRLLRTLAKLSLFYLPGIFFWWLDFGFMALMWCALVTAAGLFYKNAEGQAGQRVRRSKEVRPIGKNTPTSKIVSPKTFFNNKDPRQFSNL